MIFSKNNKSIINYLIKENNTNLEIEMQTTNIEINKKNLKINYIILDSNCEYEFYVEMSD